MKNKDWKGVKQNMFPGKAGGSVDWKGVPCDESGKKERTDLSPKMSAVKSVDRFKTQRFGK